MGWKTNGLGTNGTKLVAHPLNVVTKCMKIYVPSKNLCPWSFFTFIKGKQLD